MTATLETAERPGSPEADTRVVAYGWNPRTTLWIGAVLAALLVVVDILVAAGVDAPPAWARTLIVCAGVLLLPGIPIVVALRVPGRALSTVLIVAVSTSTQILVTQGTIIQELWNPLVTQAVIAVASLLGCLWAFRSVPGTTRSPSSRLGRADWTLRRWLSLAGLAASLVCFIVAADLLDILTVGHFGVIAHLTIWYFVGLGLLAAVIVVGVTARRLDPIVLSASVVMAVVYNTMLVGAATGETSIPTSFVHRGFINVLAEGHRLPDHIDARFSWAGFFSLFAHVQTAAGLDDTVDLLVWAPLVAGVALSFGLYAIAVAITGRARLAWVAVLLYHGFNWYQQDYFAPQALATIGYVAIIGVLLWQLRAAPLPDPGTRGVRRIVGLLRRTPGRVPGYGPGRTLAMEIVLLLIVTALVVAHQMTPILTVMALVAFAVTGTTRYRTLWIAAGLIFAAWFSYGATDFWFGHMQSIVDDIGQVGQSVGSGVSDRLNGDPTYTRMQYLRMLASGGFAAVAFVGWCLNRSSRAWLVGGLLSAAPFLLVVLQSYGGEMVIRSFLLASPMLAPYAALALASVGAMVRRAIPHPARWSRIAGLVLIWLGVVALGCLETTNRGLNTAFEASTRDEVVLSMDFIQSVEPETRVMSIGHAPHTIAPRRVLDPTGPRFSYIDSNECLENLGECVAERSPDYVYITNQGMKMSALQYGADTDRAQAQIDGLVASGAYEVITRTDSIEILRATGREEAGTR
ncbi:hypothetical protein [Gordonia sp. NB41Y]|uniref:hypothetical protein n=1 Tax=Gordonia sp. NB41Y TaxID=875808 RepID=UPI0021C87729|nr:hypothetical protein [Gordonia sp. NB41Y]WLP90940.1 hypothetical protein Q9K23_01195 [Gordonia sp. NB41Y]